MNLYPNLYFLIFPQIVILYHLAICKCYICCVLLHDRTNPPVNISTNCSFVNTLPICCSNCTRTATHTAKFDDIDWEQDFLLDKQDASNVLNVEDKFYRVNTNTVGHSSTSVSTKDKFKWASFEVRRFTYKLGTVNKRLRKVGCLCIPDYTHYRPKQNGI